MSLTELIAGVEDHEKRLTVFNADSDAVAALSEQFHDRNVDVVGEHTPSGRPKTFAVLSSDGSFVTAADVDNILEPTTTEETEPGFDGEAYQPILDHLDETMFTSYDIGQMVAASREIEDRAWRVGKGTLHSGFQKLSILQDQMDIYEQLAEKKHLEVHAYAVPDADVPDHDSDLTIHVERSDEIERSWFVAYDGAGVDVNKCALLAEEREPRSFYGFWTYDPSTVDWIIDHLDSTYGLVESQ
ncbi:DICT domain protein [Natronomonas pharaonis DSM 2160]|uniref:DICT domain protein n=1 Tax=Natronomonas pharaonis (strain ATCC 35678 / DSM 2160 / CIP 103997 / JCM 8858 / NBRC 14720 / NCIMB 2260 / Gabara) TaxID=348780 RepID=A0A1U7EY31_NATPD|nr:DICT sensory domain-containing protein [Natronomonas pharaonis]CAI50115.1 DICT domain protein [Natronomonas pharaonis DSM 2160]